MRRTILACVAAMALPGTALAQPGPAINGITPNTRVFNDFPNTTLGTVVLPGSVTVTETAYADDGVGGNFANRHDFLLSANGGATQATFGINDSFSFSTIVTLAVGSVTPRKEAGIRLNSNVTGDALFIVNSDAGEIVAFGGGAPFYSFGNNSGGNGYVPGTPILLGINIFGGGAPGVPNSIEYFIDRTPADPLGVVSSGLLPYSNLEGGPVAYNVGMYVQGAPNLTNPLEFVNASFTNIQYSPNPVPEPASIATTVIGLLGLGAVARKRS